MGKIKTYRDLIAWKKAMALVETAYKATAAFPKEEIYGLASQIRRCSVSIPSNIAEGYGRNSKEDYLRFLRIARGSLYEFQTQIEIAANLSYLDKEYFSRIFESAREVERILNGLISSLNKSEV